MTYMPGGLGGLGDAAFDAAKLALESRTGIPYTGPATTAEQLQAVQQILVRIANGDVSAMVEGLTFPDPFVTKIARDYLQRLIQGEDAAYVLDRYHLTPAIYEQVMGHSITTEPRWRWQRENQVLATLFPILGGGRGVILGTDQRVHVYGDPSSPIIGPNQSVYDLDYDFAALRAGAEALKASGTIQPTGEAPPSPEAIQRVQQAAAPLTPSGPPSGWRYNGSDGWWGPDGKFYPGDANSTPWSSGQQGVSVETYKQTPPPPPPQTNGAVAGGGEPEPTPSVPSTPTDGGSSPVTAPTAQPVFSGGGGGGGGVAFGPPPITEMAPSDTGAPAEGTPLGTAGMSGTTALLLAAGLLGAAWYAGRKR